MKKRLWILLALVLLLCACANPAPQPSPTPEKPVAPSILDGKTSVDGALFSLSNAYAEGGVQQKLHLFAGSLLVFGPQYRTDGAAANKIALLSLSTGEVTAQKDVAVSCSLQVCGNTIVLLDAAAGTVTFLDETLQETRRMETKYSGGMLVLDPAGTRLYCVTAQQGIRVIDLASEKETVLLPHAVNLYGSELRGRALSLTYTEKATQLHRSAVLDTETGTVMEQPFEGVFYGPQWEKGTWLCGVYGENGKYLLGTAQRPYCVTLTEPYSSASLLSDPGRILVKSQTAEGMALWLYATDGTFLSRLATDGVPTNFLWWEQEGGYLFLCTDSTGHDRLMFWDLGVPVSGAPLALAAAYTAPEQGTAVKRELYEKAEEIGKAYGVAVRIAEQIDESYQEFTAAVETEEQLIAAGLEALEKTFVKFPADFFPQLRYGTQMELEIHLTGAIGRRQAPAEVSGFTGFNGFTERRAAKTVVALDLTRPGALGQVFCHEMAHVIEGKLDFDASLRKDALYSESGWQKLNPAGFVYAETYDEMPMSYFTDGHDAYFIDLYSRTYAKEDRARILEHAMAGNGWIFSSPQRKAKLQYLCACIRDCFDTDTWPEKTFWEQAL